MYIIVYFKNNTFNMIKYELTILIWIFKNWKLNYIKIIIIKKIIKTFNLFYVSKRLIY